MRTIGSLVFGSLILFSHLSQAEPWLANKYSTNCAACHSPGRVNREASKRKCTLSCQGCHVNPNGGGIRNQYGKWNSQRWLKSFDAKSWIFGKRAPAPVHYQAYASHYPKEVRPSKISKKGSKKYRKKGQSRLVTLKSKKFLDLKDYNKYSDRSWNYNAQSDQEFEKFLTKRDPYFLEKHKRVNTNAEMRYFVLSNSGDQGRGPATVGYRDDIGAGMMALDFGLQFKPFLDPSFSMVFEHRYLNSPYVFEWNAIFRASMLRSAYAIYDALPYNTYVMAGIFRPMFGLQTSNHRSLREVIAFGYSVPGANAVVRAGGAGAAAVRYEGVSIGSSPNVPFFNFSLLTNSGLKNVTEGSTGFVANAGLRFVTLGASALASYWSTETLDKRKKEMLALNFGASYWKLTGNFEFLGFSEEFQPGLKNSGSVMTFDLKLQLYRESYLTFGYALSNTSRTQTEGEASDLSVGYKIFALAGTEFDISYNMQTNKDLSTGSSVETNWNTIMLQAHLFF